MQITDGNSRRSITGAEMRGRGIGMLVGTAFATWWAITALNVAPKLQAWPLETAIGLVTVALAGASIATFWRGTRIAATATGSHRPRRRIWAKFLLVLVAEIVALNLIAWALTHYHLGSCMLAAIAIIVGLHFFPLASVFHTPFMRITASAMTLAGAGAGFAIIGGSAPTWPNAIAACVCAIALWATVAAGWLRLRTALASVRGDVAFPK